MNWQMNFQIGIIEGGQQYHYDSIEGFTRTSRAYYKKKPWITDLKRYSYRDVQNEEENHR